MSSHPKSDSDTRRMTSSDDDLTIVLSTKVNTSIADNMDDSPRSSKRRKLDTPKRLVSSPLVKSSAKRASGRLANRSKSYAAGGAEEETEKGRPTKRAPKGPSAKRAATPDIDIYDDIEGALSIEPSLGLAQRRSLAASKEGTESTTDELQKVTKTTKRGKGRPKNASSARSASKTLGNGHKHSANEEADTQDELATEATTGSKRRKATRTPAAATRRSTPPRSSTGRRGARAGQEEGTEGDGSNVNGGTPLKPRSTRKPASSTRKKPSVVGDEEHIAATPSKSATRRTTIPETEDELDARPLPSSRKLQETTGARRRSNWTDNTGNENDEVDIEYGAKDEDDGDVMEIDGNSVMESILDPTEPSPFNKPNSAQKTAAPPLIYGNLPAGRELDLIKTVVLERITARRPCPLVNLDAEYKTVHQIIEQTITAGEGNSMLLIGARGSGKTALVNKVLSEVAKDNAGEYHVVRLNGFIHTDDKIALREIWRQLGKEMDIEEDGSGPGKNYADTLTTLLALLSHPSEHTGEYTDQVAKAVVFVMDEFDLFAQHPRQTLLYNLFDIAQSRKAPIAVLGLTTRIDVTNSLEKRVKSRFSHRYVHLSLAKTFTTFQDMCKSGLIIEPEHLSVEERGILEGGAKTAQATSMPSRKGKKDTKQDVLAKWNANIDKLFASPTFLTQHLAPHFYRTKSVPAVLNTFFLPTATLSADIPFAPNSVLNAPDSKLFLIPDLSTLALSLLIAAARLDIIHDSDTCNFNMAYDEYVTLASKARIQSAAGGISASGSVSKVWGKDVAKREWESLVELGLIMPVIQGQAGDFGMIRCDVALEEIGAVLSGEKGVDRHLERWCKAI